MMLNRTRHKTHIIIDSSLWFTLLIMLLVAMPILTALISAFFKDHHVSLHHIIEIASDARRLINLALNTAIVSAVAVLVSLGFGVPLGFLIFRTDLPLSGLWKIILIATCCLPTYVVVSCAMAAFNLQIWSCPVFAAGWVAGLTYISLMGLISGLAFKSVDPTLEQLTLMNTTPFRTFLYVTLPQASWGILAGALVVTILTISDITITDVILVRTFTEEVFAEFQLNRSHGPAAAVALPMIVTAILLGTFLTRLIKNTGESLQRLDVTNSFIFKLNRWKIPCLFLIVLLVFIGTAPFVLLINQIESLEKTKQTLNDVRTELFYSVALGFLASILTSLLAWGPARLLARNQRAAILGWVILLMVTPAPLVGIGLAKLMNRPGPLGWIYDSPLIVVLVFVIRFLPYHILIILSSLRSLPASLEEEASLAGATRFQSIWYVIAPLCLSSTILGAILVFILSLGEVGASVLVVPPGKTTLTIHFFTLIHYGVYSSAAIICLLLACVVVFPSVIVGLYIQRVKNL